MPPPPPVACHRCMLPPDRRAASQAQRAEKYWSQVASLRLERVVVANMLGAERKAGADTYVTRQIAIDLVRLVPNLEFDSATYPVMTEATISAMFMRMLAVWSARHPAVGYVQGLDRLVVPFFRTHFFGAASLSEASGEGGEDREAVLRTPPTGPRRARAVTSSPRRGGQGGAMSRMSWEAREAACYWCLEKLLEGIQDRFIHNQPALQARCFVSSSYSIVVGSFLRQYSFLFSLFSTPLFSVLVPAGPHLPLQHSARSSRRGARREALQRWRLAVEVRCVAPILPWLAPSARRRLVVTTLPCAVAWSAEFPADFSVTHCINASFLSRTFLFFCDRSFLSYAVPWLSTLQTLDLPEHALMRFWDAGLADDNGDASGDYSFTALHLHGVVELLLTWRTELLELDEIETIQFLQKPPCRGWNEDDVYRWLTRTYSLRERLAATYDGRGLISPSAAWDGEASFPGVDRASPLPPPLTKSPSRGWFAGLLYGSDASEDDSEYSDYSSSRGR